MNSITLAIGHLANTPRQYALIKALFEAGENGNSDADHYEGSLSLICDLYDDCLTPPLNGLIEALMEMAMLHDSMHINPMVKLAEKGFSALSVSADIWSATNPLEAICNVDTLEHPENIWLSIYARRFNNSLATSLSERAYFAMTPVSALAIDDDQASDLASFKASNESRPDYPQVIEEYMASLSVFDGHGFTDDIEKQVHLWYKQFPGITTDKLMGKFSETYPTHVLSIKKVRKVAFRLF